MTMGRFARIALVGLIAGIVLCAARATPALAYPQWQFSSGVSRCNVCHFSPSGGGLTNTYGRDANGEDLSTFAGEGAFLYGAIELPSWLAVGADLRGAYAAHDAQARNGVEQAVFPMQADLEARVRLPWGFSGYGTGGLRGQARANGDIVPQQNYQPISTSQLISREHWLMWQRSAQGWYVRAGRFYAPFGLRLAEHITYIRRDLGFDMLRESYNVSGGFVVDDWELHLTAFAPDFLRHIGAEQKGAAAYYERRVLNQTGSVAVQSKYATGNGAWTVTEGVVGKYYLAPLKTLFLAEADLVQVKANRVSMQHQFVGAAGASLLPVRGVMLTLLGERKQDALLVRNAGWDAITALLGWFPVPHAELQLMGRLQYAEGVGTAKTLFLQVHYFL
jgi:hypothetical protein